MPRLRRRVLLPALVFAAVLACVPAATAQAAQRTVPFGFIGTTLISELISPRALSDAALEQQMGRMAQSGVESLRIVVAWGELQPAPDRYNWAPMDRLVAAAARHGITFFPNLTASPRWASERPSIPDHWRYGPRDPNTYAEFMRQAVLRYGPRGSFWAQNPGLDGAPIREWQIWNEPQAPWFWRRRPFAPSYTRLLKASYRAIHSADSGAKVITGGLVAPNNEYAPWDGMRDLYRAGAKGSFDGVAVHPFTNEPGSAGVTVRNTLEVVRRVRTYMRRRGDRRKPVLLTEMTWPAAVGRAPRNALFGLETTSRGQAARLRAAYRLLTRERRRQRIANVYWFTWASEYDNNENPSTIAFRYTGLNRYRGQLFTPMPILRAFTSVAAKYQGCRKSTDARRCR